MSNALSPTDTAKYVAARRSAELVENGMKVGLGTGSTAAWMVRRLGERVRDEGLRFVGVPTSTRTADLARSEGISITTLEDAGTLDLTIDGADEFDAELSLIKGGGGALLQEKIVATASTRMVVIADMAKRVDTLGAFPLPVEVIPFGWTSTMVQIDRLLQTMDVDTREIVRRMADDTPYRTDEGNFILDLHLGRIGNARQLAMTLNQVAGVVENGLFIDVCNTVIIGYADGTVEVSDLTGETAAQTRPDGGNLFAD